MRIRIRLLALLCLYSVGYARATPRNLPYTDKQFEMAVACIKHFEGDPDLHLHLRHLGDQAGVQAGKMIRL